MHMRKSTENEAQQFVGQFLLSAYQLSDEVTRGVK